MALFRLVIVWFVWGFASYKSSAIENEKMLRENKTNYEKLPKRKPSLKKRNR